MIFEHQAFIGLGSNLDDPLRQLDNALSEIDTCPQMQVENLSSFYQSAPIGPQDQPSYINAVCQISTSLAPLDLLTKLQSIESNAGRVRIKHWGARVLDLDILLYDKIAMSTQTLVIPHPEMLKRNFVLLPLEEITGSSFQLRDLALHQAIEQCPPNPIKKIQRTS